MAKLRCLGVYTHHGNLLCWWSDGQPTRLCRYSNQAGIEIRARDFGGLGGIDTLVPGLPSLMPMYRGLTRALKHEGYQERRDLFGAPYDFRMAADGLEQVSTCSILACGQCCAAQQALQHTLSAAYLLYSWMFSDWGHTRVLQALLHQRYPGHGFGAHKASVEQAAPVCTDRILCGSEAAN